LKPTVTFAGGQSIAGRHIPVQEDCSNPALLDTDGQVSCLWQAVLDLKKENAELKAKLQYMSVANLGGHPAVTFDGVNVYIRNGSNSTMTTNGVGNLILGYNESTNQSRTGSHNIVTGLYNEYT